MGDLKGAGDVGDSEYGEKADMRLRSGDGSIGDFKAMTAEVDAIMKAARLIGAQLFLRVVVEIVIRKVAEDVEGTWAIKTKGICWAGLDE